MDRSKLTFRYFFNAGFDRETCECDLEGTDVFEDGHYKIMVWLPKDGKGVATSSVHTEGYEFNGDKISESGVCVLSSFNEYRSKQLASILLRGLWGKKLYVYGNR